MLFRVSLGFLIDGFAIFLQQHAYKRLYSMSVVFVQFTRNIYIYIYAMYYMKCYMHPYNTKTQQTPRAK